VQVQDKSVSISVSDAALRSMRTLGLGAGMLGAVGWWGALIPLILVSGIVVGAYMSGGVGSRNFRCGVGLSYFTLVIVNVIAFFAALNISQTRLDVAGGLLITLTVIAALGLLLPWFATRVWHRWGHKSSET
jgi:hypothetical protein